MALDELEQGGLLSPPLPDRASEMFADGKRRLLDAATATEVGVGWGYPFPWQSRSFFVPRHEPNAVCSVFGARAMLALHRRDGDPESLQCAVGVTDLLRARNLDRVQGRIEYVANTGVQVINVWALAAALFLEMATVVQGESREGLRSDARTLVRSVMECQSPDGSWPYGLASNQRFVDGYHTGFILEALRDCQRFDPGLGDEVERGLRTGYRFYWDHLIDANGAAKASLTKSRPVDVHAVAQAVLTACAFADDDEQAEVRARRSYDWWDAHGMRHGLPAFQVGRWHTNETVHIRWGVAWLAFALARARRVFGWT